MSPRDWRLRIEDILESINNIQNYIKDMSFEEFVEDTKTIRASAYEISIIGESAGRIPVELQEHYPQVPWTKMQEMCNIVIHEYFRVDPVIVWQTATQNLPPLIPILQAILKEKPDE